jgi:hypothetical protein
MAEFASDPEKKDLESAPAYTTTTVAEVGSVEAVKARDLQSRYAFFRGMRKGEEWLDAKMGIESTGVDRIPEEDKEPPSIWNVCLSYPSFRKRILLKRSCRSSFCGGRSTSTSV